MNLLAIETSTEFCSVALTTGDGFVERSEFAPRRHAELLLPMCGAVLAEAGLVRSALDVIAVGRGPGAFTGVRLAIAAVQGMALALDRPVIPVSSLAALALQAPMDDAAILAVIDARMGEIYAGVYRRDDRGLVEPIGEEWVGSAAELVVPNAGRWSVIGSGWDAHRDALAARLPGTLHWADGARYPQAIGIARLALPRAYAGEGVAPERALPVYLRDKVALTTAEREAARAG